MSECNRYRLIGDPHITRKFKIGVPLDRRGEREDLLFTDFENRLNSGIEPVVIVVGDLLEKPICSIEDLYRIFEILQMTSRTNPERQYLIMAGNHDISPEKDQAGCFEILQKTAAVFPNIEFVTEPMVYKGIALFPWQWHRTALEQLEDVQGELFDVAVGHWDLMSYDDHVDHLCPAKELDAMGVGKIHSGHWHVAGEYKVNGIEVHCTGSMQPMTHAEDPDGIMYITISSDDYINSDPSDFENKYVRVTARRGEDVEPPASCLGFKVQRDKADEEYERVEMEEFSVDKILSESFTKHNVVEEVRDFIEERIDASN